jgi:hypothetical protein
MQRMGAPTPLPQQGETTQDLAQPQRSDIQMSDMGAKPATSYQHLLLPPQKKER